MTQIIRVGQIVEYGHSRGSTFHEADQVDINKVVPRCIANNTSDAGAMTIVGADCSERVRFRGVLTSIASICFPNGLGCER